MHFAGDLAPQRNMPASRIRGKNGIVSLDSEDGSLPISAAAPDITEVARYIYVVGPSSSGKSTLCHAFAKDTGVSPVAYIKEMARNVMRTHGFTRADVGTFEMQSAIMTAQLRAEIYVITKSQEDSSAANDISSVLLLSDRSAVDPIVYAASSTAVGAEDMALRLRHDTEFEAALSRYRESLFVLLTPVAEWIKDDGVRSLENPWRYCDYLRKILQDLEIPFREIGEDVRDIHARVRLVRHWAKLHDIVPNNGQYLPVVLAHDGQTMATI